MELLPHFFIFFGGSCDRRRSSVVRACAPLRLVSVRRFDFPWGLRMIGGFPGAIPAILAGFLVRAAGPRAPPPPCVSQLAAARALAVRAPESGHFAEFFLSYPRICSRLCPAAPLFGGFRG